MSESETPGQTERNTSLNEPLKRTRSLNDDDIANELCESPKQTPEAQDEFPRTLHPHLDGSSTMTSLPISQDDTTLGTTAKEPSPSPSRQNDTANGNRKEAVGSTSLSSEIREITEMNGDDGINTNENWQVASPTAKDPTVSSPNAANPTLSRASTNRSATEQGSKQREKSVECAAIRLIGDVTELLNFIPKDAKNATSLRRNIQRSMKSMELALDGKSLRNATLELNHEPEPVEVLYRVRLLEKGQADKFWYQDTPFSGIDLDKQEPAETEQLSIFDVIIDVEGKIQNPDVVPESETRKTWDIHRSKTFSFGQDIILSNQKLPAIKIYSKYLVKALGTLIAYYPSLSPDFSFISHPYNVFLLHFPMIAAFRYTCEQDTPALSEQAMVPDDMLKSWTSRMNSDPNISKRPSTKHAILDVLDLETSKDPQSGKFWRDYDFQKHTGSDKCDVKTAHHIEVLLARLVTTYMQEIVPELEYHKQYLASFSKLWVLFRPGIDVLAKVKGRLSGFVVHSCETRPAKKDPKTEEEAVDQVVVTAWNLEYAGSRIYRDAKQFTIAKFEGIREICSFDVFPAWCDSERQQKLGERTTREVLQSNGESYYELAKQIPAHRYYEGHTLESTERYSKMYRGEILIDPKGYLQNYNRKGHVSSMDDKNEVERSMFFFFAESSGFGRLQSRSQGSFDDSPRLPPDRGGGKLWEGYNNIDPTTTPALTEHQHFLLPRHILGFALKNKEWRMFDIDQIKPLQDTSSAMNRLILPVTGKHLQMISMVLADSLSDEADFVKDKGKARVVLLHGAPGTGKTYTVECLSRKSKRPLLALTVADLGNKEEEMEERLSTWFRLAESWKAIILIDEADVFLEARKAGDLKRNCLIAVFLRTMEYYSGILFLTSNRVGQIDSAFASRILLALPYNIMSVENRIKLWTWFFELNSEEGKLGFAIDAESYVASSKVTQYKLNGRDIRNAVQAAILLARQDRYQNEEGQPRTNLQRDDRKTSGNQMLWIYQKHLETVLKQQANFLKYQKRLFRMTPEQKAFQDLNRYTPGVELETNETDQEEDDD